MGYLLHWLPSFGFAAVLLVYGFFSLVRARRHDGDKVDHRHSDVA